MRIRPKEIKCEVCGYDVPVAYDRCPRCRHFIGAHSNSRDLHSSSTVRKFVEPLVALLRGSHFR